MTPAAGDPPLTASLARLDEVLARIHAVRAVLDAATDAAREEPARKLAALSADPANLAWRRLMGEFWDRLVTIARKPQVHGLGAKKVSLPRVDDEVAEDATGNAYVALQNRLGDLAAGWAKEGLDDRAVLDAVWWWLYRRVLAEKIKEIRKRNPSFLRRRRGRGTVTHPQPLPERVTEDGTRLALPLIDPRALPPDTAAVLAESSRQVRDRLDELQRLAERCADRRRRTFLLRYLARLRSAPPSEYRGALAKTARELKVNEDTAKTWWSRLRRDFLTIAVDAPSPAVVSAKRAPAASERPRR